MLSISHYQIDPMMFEIAIFKTHLKCFRWYGYIIGKNQNWQWLHLLRCTIFTASIWLSCAMMLTRVFRGYKDLNEGATSWATAVQFLAVSITTLNAYLQRKRVVHLLMLAYADLQQLQVEADALELQYLQQTDAYVRFITYLLWIPSVVAGFMALLDCFFRSIFMPETVFNVQAVRNGDAQPILLFKLFPFGDVVGGNFFIGYLGAWYALLLGITTIPLWHTFIACLMKFVTLKLEIQCKRMAEMDVTRLNKNLKGRWLSVGELNYWRLKLCGHFVEEQLKIRSFVSELEMLIRAPVFADFMIFSVLMCFLFLGLTMGAPSKVDYFFIFIYLLVMALILWVYHWHATLIVEHNDQLGFAIYCCEWYNYSLPVQKNLRLLMLLSKRPLKMRALFVELNLRTFIDIVRGAYSYFNLLRSTNMMGADFES